MCLSERVVDLVEEATRLQAKNTRMATKCARLSVENTQLVEDHARLRDQSIKITKEVKARNQEITSKWPLS
jgi:predicted nuclease with TOPRIM domain